MLLTDAAAGFAAYALYLHAQYRLSVAHRNATQVAVNTTRADDLPAVAGRTAQFILTGLNMKDILITFVRNTCTFLVANTKGMI
jgi:hypothetical protein